MMNTLKQADWYFNKYKTSLGYKFRTGTQASLTPDENIIYNGFKGDIADYVWRVNEQHSTNTATGSSPISNKVGPYWKV